MTTEVTKADARLERFQAMRKEAQEEMEYIPALRLLQAQTKEVSNPPEDIVGDPRAGRYFTPHNKTVMNGPLNFIALDVRKFGYRIDKRDDVIDAWDDIPDHIKEAEKAKNVVAKWGYKVFGWLPEQKHFCIFFLGGRGGGRACGEKVLDYFLQFKGQATPVKFKARFVPTDKFSWWTTDVCEAPPTADQWTTPDPATFDKVLALFSSLKKREKEVEAAAPPR